MGLIVRELEAPSFLLAVMRWTVFLMPPKSSQTVPIAVGWMNKAVSILGINTMGVYLALTQGTGVRYPHPQPDFKETVSVNGTTLWGIGGTGRHT